MEKIVIVGAGPAGLKAAEILAKNKKEVLVLEQKNIIGNKVCAGGLTNKSLSFGIPDNILQRKFNELIIHSKNKKSSIKSNSPFIATINRKDLGKWMAKNAKEAGAEIKINTKVDSIGDKSLIANGKKINFDYLIGADGSNSIVRKNLGIKTTKILEAFQYVLNKKVKDIEMYFDVNRFGPAYAWIFPYKNSVSIGTGADSNYKKLKVSEVKNNLDKWCIERGYDIKNARLCACPINYDYQGHEFGNKFLVGDAAGFSSGLTGEGIYFAMLSGSDVANKIINKDYDYKNIKHILRVKKYEEIILRTLEISKSITRIEYNLLINMVKFNWFDKKLIKLVD
ncbi:MAG: NAD(P)/FAD-dependent oxidoreductase [Nanoarchaeota archaeon]|nr:NAD(P)/FAD-dependent oxidoreductase [Nanoarchaeota archaeon]